jgi:arylsulfatase A-like enzyme
MHYRYSYNENLEAPAILYQPALFKPRVFGFPTSHVDILPTLLDAMRVPYPSMVFDGESLFNYTLRRKSIFFYGYEESISSLDTHLIKVQYSLKKNRCWAFDLKFDPDEKKALHKFVSDHDSNLLKYNANLRGKKGFQGTQAPVAKD